MFSSYLNIIENWWWSRCYDVTKAISWLLGVLYDLFEKAVGLDTVSYDGQDITLLQIVFSHSAISRAYWTMAIIGIGLCFFFTILAVLKKMADTNDEVKSSLGQMLTRCLQSIIIICAMSMIMSMAMYFTSTLMEGVNIAFFSSTDEPTASDPKTYSKEEYATMARVMNTIGNYSLNPSYDSRYNINSCYNAIRADLLSLKEAGTFSVQYETPDILNEKEHYWQEALQKIVVAAPSLQQDITIDKYNEALSTAIENVMEEIKNDKQFLPLEKYAASAVGDNSSNIELDRLVLLVGTLDASYDSEYNGTEASVTDLLRAPFYYNTSDHDVYNTEHMWNSFDLSEYHFVYVLFMAVVMAWNMANILLTAIARIFNMAILYIASPPIIATAPLDDGAKFKQWRIAFMIQCFSVFGIVVAIDLMITFIPIIMSNQLVIFDSTIPNYLAKLVIIWAGLSAARKASSLITGIIGENVAMTAGESLHYDEEARDMRKAAGYMSGGKVVETMFNNAKERAKEHLPLGGRSGGGGGRDVGATTAGQTNAGGGTAPLENYIKSVAARAQGEQDVGTASAAAGGGTDMGTSTTTAAANTEAGAQADPVNVAGAEAGAQADGVQMANAGTQTDDGAIRRSNSYSAPPTRYK